VHPEELFRILHRQPFQPFRVHLKDGRCYDVRYQNLAIVGKTFFLIGIPMPDQAEPFYDYMEHVNLVDIDRVELLEATAPPVAG
jgi:hypothetical protein